MKNKCNLTNKIISNLHVKFYIFVLDKHLPIIINYIQLKYKIFLVFQIIHDLLY